MILKVSLNFCCEAKVKYIFFTGGEPLTYPHLPEILQYIKTRRHPITTAVATNGVLLSNMELCRMLIDSGLGYVDVSMQRKKSEGWCEMTGYDGTEKQHQAIRNLASLPIEFTCSMVIKPPRMFTPFAKLSKSLMIMVQSSSRSHSSSTTIMPGDKDLIYLQKHDPIKLVRDFISQR